MARTTDSSIFDEVIGGAVDLTFAFVRTLIALVSWRRLCLTASETVRAPHVSATTFFGVSYLISLSITRVSAARDNGTLTRLPTLVATLSSVTTTTILLTTLPVLALLLVLAKLLAFEVPERERAGVAALVIYVAGLLFLATGAFFVGMSSLGEAISIWIVLAFPVFAVIDTVGLIMKHLWSLYEPAPLWRRFPAALWRAITIVIASLGPVAACLFTAYRLTPDQISIRPIVNTRIAPNRVQLLIENTGDDIFALPRDSVWVYSKRHYELDGRPPCIAPGIHWDVNFDCLGSRAHVVNWPNDEPFQFLTPGRSLIFDSDMPDNEKPRIVTVLFTLPGRSNHGYYVTTEWFSY